MKRTWLPFLAFLALALAAMAWMTRTVLHLEAAQAKSAAAAQLEENVRLALWRMDYKLAPILSQETARPWFEYAAFFPADRAAGRPFNDPAQPRGPATFIPSPLLKSPPPYVLLNFQTSDTGDLTSPQVPTDTFRPFAESNYTTPDAIQAAAARCEDLRRTLKSNPDLFAAVPPPPTPEAFASNRLRLNNNGTITANTAAQPPNAYAQQINAPQYDLQQQQQIQTQRGVQEYQARASRQLENADLMLGNNYANAAPATGVVTGVMQPLWTADHTLLLARRVSIDGHPHVQGCLLDWPALRSALLETLADLPLQADLVPAHSPTDDKQPRLLASIPARLELSPSSILHPPSSPLFSSPTHVTLIIAWLATLLAAAAVALLLRGVMALSERRGAFVSAVTHELRTPLTTLRMYTEMLADGMVTDPDKQSAYHRTLRAEANRLGHLVDNVLLYSRLERSARNAKIESAPLGDLLDRITPRLADRAAQAGMRLNVHLPPTPPTAAKPGDSSPGDPRQTRIRANLLSVEQILFNLVDNACKYAATAPDPAIDLTARLTDDHVELTLTDHGPGLDPTARARLFQPFSKSVTEAANTAPGLGLGLALSHRLAKNMNASLQHTPTTSGTTFTLTLPKA